MFKMNKLLAKHIMALDPTSMYNEHESKFDIYGFPVMVFPYSLLLFANKKFAEESGQAKKPKVEDYPEQGSTECSPPPVLISDSLVKFFGTGEREMLQSVALGRVWDYIKVNQLEVGLIK